MHDLFTVLTGFYADVCKKLINDFYSHFTKKKLTSLSGSICKILSMVSAK